MNAVQRFPLSLLFIALLVGCGGTPAPQPQPQPTEKPRAGAGETTEEEPPVSGPVAHENLQSVLWTQTSVEWAATTRTAYAAARLQLDRALKDKKWTAAIEQTQGFSKKPPAVILDVDETVLDNSAYQARLIESGEEFNSASWNAWCEEEKAGPVPGALEFTRYAAENGVAVFYVTNRDHQVEEATRKNLEKLGFPLSEKHDVILTKKEKPEWGSDKTPRRELVAENFRIIMLFGDNLGDFIGAAKGSPEARQAAAAPYEDRWGTMWFMFPNPMYGYWEGALYGYEYDATSVHKLRDKLDALEGAE